MRHLRTWVGAPWPLIFVLSSWGCGQPPVDGVITAQLQGEGSIRDRKIVVPRGRVLAFVAQPMGGDEPLPVTVRLESDDPGIAQIERLEKMNQFVAIGVRRGSTSVQMFEERGALAQPTLTVEVQ